MGGEEPTAKRRKVDKECEETKQEKEDEIKRLFAELKSTKEMNIKLMETVEEMKKKMGTMQQRIDKNSQASSKLLNRDTLNSIKGINGQIKKLNDFKDYVYRIFEVRNLSDDPMYRVHVD